MKEMKLKKKRSLLEFQKKMALKLFEFPEQIMIDIFCVDYVFRAFTLLLFDSGVCLLFNKWNELKLEIKSQAPQKK